MTTKELQARQADYDEAHWQHQGQNPDDQIRHVLLHLVKLTGKVATYSEAVEHGQSPSLDPIAKEVVPDLLAHALRLSNLLGIDLDQAYVDRLEDNIQRLQAANAA